MTIYFYTLKLVISTLYSNNVYVNNLASLNTLLNGKASAGSILVQVYSTEVTKVLTNDSSYNRANAQVWFTRASATGFQYIMVDYTLGEIYTGAYNPTSGATTKVYNFSKHPTRSEVDSLNNSMTYKAGDSVIIQAPFVAKATASMDGFFGAVYLPKPASKNSLTVTLSNVASYGVYYSDGLSHTVNFNEIDNIALNNNVLWFKIPATGITDASTFAWIRIQATVTFS